MMKCEVVVQVEGSEREVAKKLFEVDGLEIVDGPTEIVEDEEEAEEEKEEDEGLEETA